MSATAVVFCQVQPVDDSAFFDFTTWSAQRAVATFQEALCSGWKKVSYGRPV